MPLTHSTDATNTPTTAGEELCAKVQYLGAGGLQLLVGGKLTVGFLAENHTDADIGAFVRPCYMGWMSRSVIIYKDSAAPDPPHPAPLSRPNRDDARALQVLHVFGRRPLPLHALGPARRGRPRPERAVRLVVCLSYTHTYM